MRRLVCAIIAVAICLDVMAQGRISYHTDEVADGDNFVLFMPDSVKSPKPLIIALHSRSASGNNLQDVDYFGTIDAIESGVKIDAAVMAPQTSGAKWDVAKVMNDVEYVVSQYDIDPNRIYAIGMSMGGNGVADMVAAYPDRIAAAIILAGGITHGDPAEMAKVPTWVVRGLNDRDEAILRTDEMVRKICNADSSRIAYSKVKGLDHRQHERILYMPHFYYWLLSHKLDQQDRPISPTFSITTKVLNKAYNGLNLRDGSAAKRKSRRHGHHRGPRRW